MFNIFRGKSDKAAQEAPESRGFEVRENDDPDTVWSMWDSALAEQESRFGSTGTKPAPLSSKETVPKAPPPEQLPVLVESPKPDRAVQGFGSFHDDAPTKPLSLDEKTIEQRKNDALDIVELHHHRVAGTLKQIWGYKECSAYLRKLVMDGYDDKGQGRAGFNQEVIAALLALTDVHDEQFGAFENNGSLLDPFQRSGSGYDFSRRNK